MQRSTKKLKDQIKEKIKKEKEELENDEKVKWLPSGSILFNLICSDRINGAYKEGTMINIVGDSSSGKSLLALSGMAAVANNENFDDYSLIYDDAEFADSFDHEKLFGKKFVERIMEPKLGSSTTIEQFFDNIMEQIDTKVPFIYILDSFDAIDSDDEIEKEDKNREFRKQGNKSKVKGSFQATKQKKASQMFRRICGCLKKNKSILIIISQTRDNLSAVGFQTKYRAGGKALKFYSSIEVWLAYVGAIKTTVKGNQHTIGVNTLAKVTKNKYTGKRKECQFPIYYDYGIDDISSCIDFLTENKWWATRKQTIIAEPFNVEMSKNKLIEYIEENKEKREKILFKQVKKCWNSIEESLKLNRKNKYE